MSVTSRTLVGTGKASGYLQQLCKHFGHKIDVEFTALSGRIAFPFGRVELAAHPDGLAMRGTAQTEEDLSRLRTVMASHLERFAFRETLNIKWED